MLKGEEKRRKRNTEETAQGPEALGTRRPQISACRQTWLDFSAIFL